MDTIIETPKYFLTNQKGLMYEKELYNKFLRWYYDYLYEPGDNLIEINKDDLLKVCIKYVFVSKRTNKTNLSYIRQFIKNYQEIILADLKVLETEDIQFEAPADRLFVLWFRRLINYLKNDISLRLQIIKYLNTNDNKLFNKQFYNQVTNDLKLIHDNHEIPFKILLALKDQNMKLVLKEAFKEYLDDLDYSDISHISNSNFDSDLEVIEIKTPAKKRGRKRKLKLSESLNETKKLKVSHSTPLSVSNESIVFSEYPKLELSKIDSPCFTPSKIIKKDAQELSTIPELSELSRDFKEKSLELFNTEQSFEKDYSESLNTEKSSTLLDFIKIDSPESSNTPNLFRISKVVKNETSELLITPKSSSPIKTIKNESNESFELLNTPKTFSPTRTVKHKSSEILITPKPSSQVKTIKNESNESFELLNTPKPSRLSRVAKSEFSKSTNTPKPSRPEKIIKNESNESFELLNTPKPSRLSRVAKSEVSELSNTPRLLRSSKNGKKEIVEQLMTPESSKSSKPSSFVKNEYIELLNTPGSSKSSRVAKKKAIDLSNTPKKSKSVKKESSELQNTLKKSMQKKITEFTETNETKKLKLENDNLRKELHELKSTMNRKFRKLTRYIKNKNLENDDNLKKLNKIHQKFKITTNKNYNFLNNKLNNIIKNYDLIKKQPLKLESDDEKLKNNINDDGYDSLIFNENNVVDKVIFNVNPINNNHGFDDFVNFVNPNITLNDINSDILMFGNNNCSVNDNLFI